MIILVWMHRAQVATCVAAVYGTKSSFLYTYYIIVEIVEIVYNKYCVVDKYVNFI